MIRTLLSCSTRTVAGDEEVGVIAFKDGAVSGHPSLGDGVVVLDGGWGTYTFWVPPEDEYLDVSVSFPREEGDYWDEADYEARMFRVADRFLQELGRFG